MESLVKTVKAALDDLDKSREAFARLGVENESMKATKYKVDTMIERETRVLEELNRGLEKAEAHSNKLKEQVRLISYDIRMYGNYNRNMYIFV